MKAARNLLSASLMSLFLVQAQPANAASTADILANAPTLQILIDSSSSSPATSQAFMDNVAPLVVEKLKTMPMATQVIVTAVGDSVRVPEMKRTRILARNAPDGGPVEDVARKVGAYLRNFPKALVGNEHGSSHLIGGIFDAAKNVNPKSQANQIVIISDLVEYSDVTDCTKKCVLPKPNFQLPGTEVTAYGVGLGLPSGLEMRVNNEWQRYLTAAGAKPVVLRRTF